MNRVLYYVDQAKLKAAAKPNLWWHQQSLTPLVSVDPDWFYAPGHAADEELVKLSQITDGDWYASLWVTNNRGGCLLWPLDDDHHWADLCGRLAACARRVSGLRGFFLDLEFYPATPGGAAGPMNPAKAGPWAHPSDLLRQRADQFAAALPGLVLGGTITTTEIGKLPGMAQWLRRLSKHGKTWILSEDFNGASDPGACNGLGVYVPGFGNVAAARKVAGTAWVFDQELKALAG